MTLEQEQEIKERYLAQYYIQELAKINGKIIADLPILLNRGRFGTDAKGELDLAATPAAPWSDTAIEETVTVDGKDVTRRIQGSTSVQLEKHESPVSVSAAQLAPASVMIAAMTQLFQVLSLSKSSGFSKSADKIRMDK